MNTTEAVVRSVKDHGRLLIMDPELVQIFGTRFPLDELEDLELLTDLLEISGDPLGVVFAVASHLEHVPNGDRAFRPLLRQRLGRSLRQLGWPPATSVMRRVQ